MKSVANALVFGVCLAACGRRAAEPVGTHAIDSVRPDVTMIASPVDVARPSLGAAPDAAVSDTNAGDASVDAGSIEDAGPVLVNASMGAFSIANGTPTGQYFGGPRHGPRVHAEPYGIDPRAFVPVAYAARLGERYFLACFEAGRVHDRRLHGRAVIRFVIDSTGRPSNAVVTESSLPDASVATCVASVLSRTRFMALAGSSPVTVSLPFVFEAPTE